MDTKRKAFSRREFIKASGVAALGIGASVIVPHRVRARKKTLRILQWTHFVPEYDDWFNHTYIKEWGEIHDTEVIVDNVGIAGLRGRAAAEVSAQRGHDLVMFLLPPPVFEDHVIDHGELYEECQRRYGSPVDLAIKSTYNPKTKKFYGFSTSYVPDPVNYRKDLWDDVGMVPDTWEHIRTGASKIKKKHGVPVGIGLAPELDSNMVLRSIMTTFGGSVQDPECRLGLKSRATLEALKFVKALYEEAMTDEVFTWDASSNNRFLLAGHGSLTLNAISITRTAENQRMPIADKIWLAKAPKGPARQVSFMHLMNIYSIWKFAENIEGAKQFLVDYVGASRKAFVAGQFYNFPSFPQTVPDVVDLIASDPKAVPRNKYRIFEDVSSWTVNLGYPGYANAAIDELYNSWVVSTMFAKCAAGKMTAEDALYEGDQKARHIFQKWQDRGKI